MDADEILRAEKERWGPTISALLFGIPETLFDKLQLLSKKLDDPYSDFFSAFSDNLRRISNVASLPFSMALASVHDRRFALSLAAARIRARAFAGADGEIPREHDDKAVELARQAVIEADPPRPDGALPLNAEQTLIFLVH